MAFDALCMERVCRELQEEVAGFAVRQVGETVRGEIILTAYRRGSTIHLLFSADPRHARVHPTAVRPTNAAVPGPFCMLLRKYLVGGKITQFSCPPLERILEIEIEPPEGLPATRLIAEIMGRRSNLVIVNWENIILGALRPLSAKKNPRRPLIPGQLYNYPPPQNKLDPRSMSEITFTGAFESALAGEKTAPGALVATVGGLSPLLAEEITFRATNAGTAHLNSSVLYKTIRALFEAAARDEEKPSLIPGKGLYVSVTLHCEAAEKPVLYDRMGKLLDEHFSRLLREEEDRHLRQVLLSAVNRRILVLERKEEQQRQELGAAADAPSLRLRGEALLAFSSQVPRGAAEIVLPDPYRPGEELPITLDPARNAAANAQLYFKRYRKARNSKEKVARQLTATAGEIIYCRGLVYNIEEADDRSLEEIRSELIRAGYLKERKIKSEKQAQGPQPLHFTSSGGHPILVGRNNRQNDYITFRLATRRDIWLHVRQLPGSHVILRSDSLSPAEQDLQEAAFLAAYFSRGRTSGAVSVDFTAVRHVRRQPGGRPGLVFYENQSTLTANPLDEQLRRLFKLE